MTSVTPSRKAIIIVSIFLLGFCGFIFYSKPILLKLLDGSARILSPPEKAEFWVNGAANTNYICFAAKSWPTAPEPRELLVIYELDNAQVDLSYHEVYIVDLTGKAVGLPNAGDENYFLIANYILIQSESGAGWIRFTSAKFDRNDPDYVFENNLVAFTVPAWRDQPARRFEIHLNK